METCPICGETTSRRMINNKTYGRICDRCYQRKRRNKIVYPLPEYGVINYDPEGKPICHICGESYDKVLSHAYHTHGVNAHEYKKEFGLDITKGIISESAKQIAKNNAMKYYDQVIAENLTKRGVTTRFKKGHKGRTKEQMSEQTRLRLVHQNKNINDTTIEFKTPQNETITAEMESYQREKTTLKLTTNTNSQILLDAQ